MFTIYIDDSGSAPEHKLAIASGIVFPAKQLERLESEWNRYRDKEGFTDFHSSECLARNLKTEFAGWDDKKVQRVFARVRQITFKYSVQAFCIAIHKPDYKEVVPGDMLKRVGSFYTWALSSVLGLAHDWAVARSVPMEYVFDTATKEVKREIEEAMTYSEATYGDHFAGHYSFRNRKEVPALQAADLFAWTCFQRGRHVRFNHPIHLLAQQSWEAYRDAHDKRWCVVQSLNRQGIEDWVSKMYSGPEDLQLKTFKDKIKESRKPQPKQKKATS